MATLNSRRTSMLRARAFEWSLIAVIAFGLIGILGRQSSALQTQAEVAAVQSTLGSLRTSLVIDQLQRAAREQSGVAVPPQQANPFMVQGRAPSNYMGEMARSRIGEVPPGVWVFDPVCPCIGYRPHNPQGLEPERDPQALWYRVSAPTGLMTITALEEYRWQGVVIH